MELSTVLVIISAVLGIVALVAGTQWKKIKDKLAQVKAVIAEVEDLVDAFTAMLEDDKVEQAEIDKLKAEWAELKLAIKKLFGKE